MPRKPIHLEMRGGKGPRQRIWEALRGQAMAGAVFTVTQICLAAKVEEHQVRDFFAGLERAGYIGRDPSPQARGTTVPWHLLRDNGVEAPRVRRDGSPVTQGLGQEQMWRALRMLRGSDINARELAAHASTPAVAVKESTAGAYLRALAAAEYLVVTAEGKGKGKGGVLARFRLVQEHGPLPPMLTRTDAVFDPNLGHIVWVSPVTAEEVIYG